MMPKDKRATTSAANGAKSAGRPPKSITERALFRGKVAIRVRLENAALAQRLMLHFPHIPTVEALYEYAMTKLAEMTDD